jgi:2-polyprenyl-3-methyl-5-hydroxy-6-metoxy-1,4-benzoquinol methylase
MPGPCQICGASARRPFIRHDGYSLFECGGCGLVFVEPMPSAGQIAALYTDAYAGATAGYFAKVPQKMRRARRRARALARHARRPAEDGQGRFLDVGCNGGFMVEAARELGFAATGLDPDPVSLEWARQHYPANHFVAGTIEDFDPGAQQFAAVYCSEVIEHAPDANRFVTALAALMAPGAALYLTTPDIAHWRRPRDVTRWDAFAPPSHCLYFNPRNLTRLLAKHGLEVFHRRLSFKPGIKLFARRRA